MAKAQPAEKPKEESTTTDLAVASSAALALMGDTGFGTGFEGADKDSYAIPFLQILQKMSPIVDEDSPRHVEGAKAGMLYNTVTGQLFDVKENGMQVVPCYFKRSFIRWAPRDSGGGFKGEFTPEQIDQMIQEGKILVQEGVYYAPIADGDTSIDAKKNDYYADTRSHYIITIDPETGATGNAILSLTSSQIKPSRGLMTALQQVKIATPGGKRTPPMFLNLVNVSTQGLSNDQGTWSGIVFKLAGFVNSKELFEEAKAFYEAVATGAMKADYSKAPTSEGPDVSGAPKEADGF